MSSLSKTYELDKEVTDHFGNLTIFLNYALKSDTHINAKNVQMPLLN